jgi:peptide/nickel transport system ATP-binding protein
MSKTPTRSSGQTTPLLVIDGLRVEFPTPRGVVKAVDGVSFEIRPGERVAVVGESGSGKSVSALSSMGLLPPTATVSGSVRFKDRELIGAGQKELSRIRGSEIGLILQDAVAALDPLRTIGSQVEEALRLHSDMSRSEAQQRALELLREVRIGDPEIRARQHGHEMSGGMAQRAIIASVVGPEPALLIADEPTSSLDATTAEGILDVLTDLCSGGRMATLLITHDLGVVARFAERVIVMYAGRIVEEAPVDELFGHPRHPYTRGLLESVPGARGREPVKAIPGAVPDLIDLPSGCVFHPRCQLRKGRDLCRTTVPPLAPREGAPGQLSACHFAEELGPVPRTQLAEVAKAAAEPHVPAERAGDAVAAPASGGPEPLLTIEGLAKRFEVQSGMFGGGGVVHAVTDVSFTVGRGEVLALVGESGSGKSTTGKVLLGLEAPTEGKVIFDGDDVSARVRRDKSVARRIQVVFQNPDSSLDPRMRVGDVIAEPLKIHGIGTRAERRERAEELLEFVGLRRDHAERFPTDFSGGQRQRIAIARALAVRPDLVVCDEPVTALDVSVQAQILNLLQRVQREEGLAYLFIAHDLAVVRQMADRVAVMYLGHIVETAEADRFFEQPHHPYSVALLSAMSVPDPETERRRERIVLSGTVPSPFDPPKACPFHTRCWKAQPVCSEVTPEMREISPGRFAACHFPEGAEADVEIQHAAVATNGEAR